MAPRGAVGVGVVGGPVPGSQAPRETLQVSHTGAPKLCKSVDEMICFAQTDVGREVGQETRELPVGNILPAISQ